MKILHLYNRDRQKFLLGQNYTINIKPHLLYFSTEKKHKDWAEKPHSHEFTEIAFIVSGSGTTNVNGTVRDIYSGDIIVYNAGVTHSLSCHNSSPFEAHIVAFDQFEITGLRPNCLLPPQYDFLYHSSNNYNTFRVLFRQILVETDNKDVHYHEIAQSTSYTLLMYLLRMINKAHENIHENSQNEVLNRALDFIDKHYLENITLNKIAENCFISKYYLSHLFTQNMDTTIGKYILQKRLDESKRLLNFTELSISEIAHHSGFNDQSYFCRTFKKEFDITPGEYRQSTKLS